MQLLLVGLNHKTAPVEVREKLAFDGDRLREALAHLGRYASEGAILSTCNRTEVYALVGHRETGTEKIQRFLSEFYGQPPASLTAHLYAYAQRDAVAHLFAVAAGLDSMIVGEPQILGQVRDAFAAAEAGNAAGPILSQLFRQALSVGKQARTDTAISRSAVSVSYAAVELARKIFGELGSHAVLVIGAGEMGQLAAKNLWDSGVRRLMVTNRTPARAEELAAQLGAEAWEFPKLSEALAHADIVISSTGAPEPVLTAEMVRQAMRARRQSPLFLIDIAVPRDIDPRAGQLPNVYLYNIDDLEAVCQANKREREKEIRKVETIIAAEVAKFFAWWESLGVVPTINALRYKAESIRQSELDKALSKLSHLSDRDRNIINALSVAIVSKMLHLPITRLKERYSNGHDHTRTVRELFGLDEGSE